MTLLDVTRTATAPSLRITVAATLAEAYALEEAWRTLYARSENASFFQSPDWLLPLWEQLEDDAPRVFAAHDAHGRLVALLPLCAEGSPTSTLALLGGEVTDYLGALVDPAVPDALEALLAEVVRRHPPARVAITLEQLEARSPLLSANLPRGVRGVQHDQDVCPYLALAGKRTLAEVVPPSFLARTLQQRRQAERATRALSVRALDEAEVDAGMSQLFALHTQRWQPRGEAGSFASERLCAFHRSVARRAAHAGSLRLMALRDGDEPLALLLAFASHGRVLYYASGFAARHARLSPGRLVLLGLLEQALAEGADELDFLPGLSATSTTGARRIAGRGACA